MVRYHASTFDSYVYLKATTGRTNHGTEIIFSKPIIIKGVEIDS
jgi:hypothetical protein